MAPLIDRVRRRCTIPNLPFNNASELFGLLPVHKGYELHRYHREHSGEISLKNAKMSALLMEG
jgi:hypothetical protein